MHWLRGGPRTPEAGAYLPRVLAGTLDANCPLSILRGDALSLQMIFHLLDESYHEL